MSAANEQSLELFAACPIGLEYLLKDELLALGAESAHEALAGVRFYGDFNFALKACLHSRLASRILHVLVRFAADDGESVYSAAEKLPWPTWLGTQRSFAVDVSGKVRGIAHTNFAGLKVKDAIVDAHRAAGVPRPSVATDRPDVQLRLFLHSKHAALMWDLCGEPLHQRGWRAAQGEAPIKENLAAAMLMRCDWPARAARGEAFIDPMCGAGTVLLEAVAMAAELAPGLRRAERDEFAFYQHPHFERSAWDQLVSTARVQADAGLKALALNQRFYGYDQDTRLLAVAKKNAQVADLAGFIQLQNASAEHLQQPQAVSDASISGLILSNPPYGERMGHARQLTGLYRALGQMVASQFKGFGFALISSEASLLNAVGLPISKRYALKNGALDCELAIYDSSREFRDKSIHADPNRLSAGAQMVYNRLEKNQRRLQQYVQEQRLQCYRVYDADLPEYSAAIDCYDDALHIQEYLAPADIPIDVAETRFQELVQAAQLFFKTPAEKVYLKTRKRDKGGRKYATTREKTDEYFLVREGDAQFWVNLQDYLDTGLFLDSRGLRQRMAKSIRHLDKADFHFLNLFCYTATASVYAALAGATQSLSIDLSPNYIHWAEQNYDINGLDARKHRLLAADALAWIAEHCALPGWKGRFDMIYLDPPTFSNSKRTDNVLDVQRDHPGLVEACMELLAHDGELVFVCNAQRFKLAEDLGEQFQVQTLSPKSVPPDFERQPRIHSAFSIRHKKPSA